MRISFKKLFFIGSIINFAHLNCNSLDLFSAQAERVRKISAKKISTANGSENSICQNIPYCAETKRDILVNFIRSDVNSSISLSITEHFHPQHISLTTIYCRDEFHEKAKEFEELLAQPYCEYRQLNNVIETDLENANATYFVDDICGRNIHSLTGLGKFRFPHVRTEKYFIASGIKDCIFLTAFNIETKEYFCVHTNYGLIADDNCRDFTTFPTMLEQSLKKIRGENSYSAIQISFVTCYLSNGLRKIYNMIKDLGYIDGEDHASVRIDCYHDVKTQADNTNSGLITRRNTPYFIRIVGEADPTIPNDINDKSPEKFKRLDYSRPVTVYQNLSEQYNFVGSKNVIFDKDTGALYPIY